MSAAKPRLAGGPQLDLPGVPQGFRWRRQSGVAWLEVSLDDAKAAFSTRVGGFSAGPFTALNLGILTEDDPALVMRNRGLLASTLGRDPDAVAIGFQVHGSELEIHTERPSASAYANRENSPREADGQLTDHPDLTPLVLVADCVPLALSGPGAVASVHCGWRGVAAGIVARAVAALSGLCSTPAAGLSAALGPGIGPCCYQVGDEVRSAFGERKPPIAVRFALDLPRTIRGDLEHAGLDPGSIRSSELCTSCNPALFFSHRRDGGVTGRQAGLAWRDP